MPTDRPVLTLADLEDFDRYAPTGGTERRYCCPLCGADKPVDASHRSLSLRVDTGAWHCHRCNAGGMLREHWQPGAGRERAALRRVFEVTPAPAPKTADTGWRAVWDAAQPIADTPGAAYLAQRGIPVAIAEAAGVRYGDCYGRPAVLCPIADQAGQIVAFNGRHTDAGTPKAHSGGPKSAGVFATSGALTVERLVLTEAPIDALSLAVCGVPAVALCGTSWPEWLPVHCVLRPVALAFDADDAGDTATEKLRPVLTSLGATVERWRPDGGKDWNDALLAGTLTWQLFELGIDPPDAEGTPAWTAQDAPTAPVSGDDGDTAPFDPFDAEPLPPDLAGDTPQEWRQNAPTWLHSDGTPLHLADAVPEALCGCGAPLAGNHYRCPACVAATYAELGVSPTTT